MAQRRYADKIDAQMNARILQVAMRDHQPQTLTGAELDLDNEPLTRTPRAHPARAWVRYGTASALLDVEVVEWTARAVHARWVTPDGEKHHAWVWASAVQPRNDEERPARSG